jgi:asparagine synthase (glutamine-hydrolysing)
MCGIAGYLTSDRPALPASVLEAMTDSIRHRGPDGFGHHHDGPVSLGHRRLSIIDLSSGAQPLANEDGTVWVTFNGEIYNYRELREELIRCGHMFRTTSDTEVIVHAYEQWGRDSLSRLRGMFAFAIWDTKRKELFVARDRVGIKPLIYTQQAGLFAFSSELSALQSLPECRWTLDLDALDIYLHFQFIPAPYTIYQEARKLPPAHYLVVKNDGRIDGPHRYWQLELEPDHKTSENEWIERLDSLIRETVRLHLNSDVPFGAFLSGGIDSSTVVAYMSELLSQPVRTFTIGYEDAAYDERNEAEFVAKKCGTQHHLEIVKPDAVTVLPELVRHYGEPFADSSAIPTWYVSRMAASHVKMVLSGDGGDESFAGYSSYPHIEWAHRKPTSAADRTKFLVGSILRRVGLKPALPTPADTWFNSTTYFTESNRRKLWRESYRPWVSSSRRWFERELSTAPNHDLTTRFQHFDLHNYLPFDNLNKVDIASMCHGLEVRVPLLDHVLLEAVAKIPPELKLFPIESVRTVQKANGSHPLESITRKYLLKRNSERFFPKEFLQRKKKGFEVPIRPWFRDATGELQARLRQPTERFRDLFETGFVGDLLQEHVGGKDHAWRLWSLLFLDEWLRQNPGVGLPSTSSGTAL